MSLIVLIVWFTTALGGLYMLAVWLIENDAADRGTAASRLPVPVITAHLLLAITGLAVWVAYLLLGRRVLAWAALAILVAIALLGITMFARWIPVYRGPAVTAGAGQAPGAVTRMPAERNFPVVIVAAHGLLAASTLVLVLLIVLGVGNS